MSFKNKIIPSEKLDISYKIAAHIEPKYEIWEIGKGPLKNLAQLLIHLRKRDLRDYRIEVYLWVKPPGQDISYPIRLENVSFHMDLEKNLITLSISRDEIGKYGVGLHFDSFYLPAKLSDFIVGTRCYKGLFGLPWSRVAVNSSFLIHSMQKVHSKFPLMARIGDKLLKKLVGLSWKEFEELLERSKSAFRLPKSLSLKDMEKFWLDIDRAPDEGVSRKVLFIKPPLFDELRYNALSFISKDEKSSLLIVWLERLDDYEENLNLNKRFLERLEKIDQEQPYLSIEVTGDGVVTLQVHEITNESRKIIEPLIFLVILLILLISFRRFSYIILPMLSLTISLIWTFGTMVLLGMPFNTIMVAVIPLLLGLGVDYSVHLSHTYRSEIRKGREPREAIGIAIEEVGGALFLAMLTTAIAFLSFLSATVPPVRNFGILLAFGIFYTFLNAITLQASLRYLIDRKFGAKLGKDKKVFLLEGAFKKLANLILKHRRAVVSIMVIVSICMLWGSMQNRVTFDFKEFVPKNNPAVELFDEITREFPYAGHDQEHILVEGRIDTVEALKGIRKTHVNLMDDKFVARRADGTIKAYSIYTLIQQAVQLNKSLITIFNLDQNFIPRTNKDVKRFFDYLYNSKIYGMQARMLLYKENGTYRATVIQIEIDPSISNSSEDFSKNLRILSRELDRDLANYGNAKAIATGPLLITLSITDSLTKGQMASTFASFVLAFLVLLAVYRKLKFAAAAMVPVSLSMIWILGTMHFIGFDLNVLTITVTSLTIGMGIDYAIHAVERFRMSLSRFKQARDAIIETLSHTGVALLISALTTAAGFSVLIFAPMSPQVQFGVITALTISYAFVITVILLPVILIRIVNRVPSK